MNRLLAEIPFADRARALARLDRLSSDLPRALTNRVGFLLSATPDPDRALDYLERLRGAQPEGFARVTRSPNGLQSLFSVFSQSHFLSEEILQHPEWLADLLAGNHLNRAMERDEMEAALAEYLGGEDSVPPPLKLAVFRRKQLLRILLRDVQGYAELAETTAEISAVADAILNVTYRCLRNEMVRRYGLPSCDFSVIALGKLGGAELNYSSDIDLMFVYGEEGETGGEHAVTNKEFFKKIANQYTELLSTYTPEGLCYRVDLRLRPDGKLGEACLSLDAMKRYYGTRARDWELQMLIKARVAAGEPGPGEELLRYVEPLTYSTSTDFEAIEAVSQTRLRWNEKLAARRGGSEIDIKLAPGGIRDIEFLVQCLQRLHGGREAWVRHGGTLLALFRLRDKGLLRDSEWSKLASAYQFLRHLEHRLQFKEDRQTHVLPADAVELDLVARRMPHEFGAAASGSALLAGLEGHLAEVIAIYGRVIHGPGPDYHGGAPAAEPEANSLVRALDARAPELAVELQQHPLGRGSKAFDHYLERVMENQTWLGWLNGDRVLAGYVLDIFSHSPYFTDQMLRSPHLIEALSQMRRQPERKTDYAKAVPAMVDARDLRKYFRREMFRIQAGSMCLKQPIFETLADTSRLADAAVRAAYRMAVEQVRAEGRPGPADDAPERQMAVIALGRLGMREFDLASDADVIFVLPDSEAGEVAFWTRVANRMIEMLAAYTGDGLLFTVDTRLRPNGRDGELVQTEKSYRDYFEGRAEAWEGITYMKARAVAGNVEAGTTFLNGIQVIDWRRYGQSGRSRRQLHQMRMRIEREQGGENDLKAGRGGYYDIDFLLMYLRLRSAGIFFKELNTPERLEVIERMGHLDRQDAAFLHDAATLFRSVDHGMRLMSGESSGTLPSNPMQLEMLTELVARWTPNHLHDQPLEVELEQVRERTRDHFERFFH